MKAILAYPDGKVQVIEIYLSQILPRTVRIPLLGGGTIEFERIGVSAEGTPIYGNLVKLEKL